MADVTVKKIDEIDSIFYGSFKRAGSELEVEAFGMNVIDFPPDAGEQYPNHDHGHDDQEEVYLPQRGSGRIVINDGEQEIPLDDETIVRVGPTVKRQIFAGPDGMRLIALGGVPGKAYERPEAFTKGTPDPTAQQA